MADKLLIRFFDVGLGDCVYCRVPGARADGDDFHMLIDCGSLSGMALLERAVDNLKRLLPDAGGSRKRLDLLVVTHEHKDHMAGFGPELWDDFAIGAIWMNAAMNPEHPQAGKTAQLHALAAGLMQQALRLELALSPELRDFAGTLAFNNDVAMRTLRKVLPERNGIEARYVHAGQSNADLDLQLNGAKLLVLGPEQDIDHYYLGEESDPSPSGLMGVLDTAGKGEALALSVAGEVPVPGNIAPSDFRRLRSRMSSTALAFADLDGKVTNNTSVVLLLEWRGKRLLFVGDAEWDSGFKEGKGNCAWNVMWHKRRDWLKGPISFLKIGHHGSVNATPWKLNPNAAKSEPGEILDAILPAGASAKKAYAVVSTRRSNYETIPRSELLAEIGRRVSNTRNYHDAFMEAGLKTSDIPKFDAFEIPWFASPQPLRTDLEGMLGGDGYVDVEIAP